MIINQEDRIALAHLLHEGAEALKGDAADTFYQVGDGWVVSLGQSKIAMFNEVVIETKRPQALDEIEAILAKHQKPANIRLYGAGLNQLDALQERGYSFFGASPFMMWTADDSLADFELREGLQVKRLDKSHIPQLCVIYKDVYGMSDEQIEAFKLMLCVSDQEFIYGLYSGDEIVSIVTAVIYKDSVGIWSMGTPTAAQKNGYGAQLLSYVMKTHRHMGGQTFLLYASAAGKFLYDKLGWQTLDYVPYLSFTGVKS